MKSRLVVFTALLVALTAVAFAIARVADYAPSRPHAAVASLPKAPASYLGVFETGAPPDYEPVAAFAKMAGQHAEPGRLLQRLGRAVRDSIGRARRTTTA